MQLLQNMIIYATLLAYIKFLIMKKNIHPLYYQADSQCACGRRFIIGSTKEHINVEICSKCHPFYTGTAKIIDAAGRVEKFKQRLAKKRL